MRSLQDEIVRAQRELVCPVCGRKFELRDIRIKPQLVTGTLELSVSCKRGHFPVIMLVPIHLKELVKAGPITEQELKLAGKRISGISVSIEELFEKKKNNK